ncbi:MAG: hypothetical protein ACREP9_18380 [Candidatus Dormibacteraceae bacterium]
MAHRKRSLVVRQAILCRIRGADKGLEFGPQNLRSYGNRRQRFQISLTAALVRPEIFPADVERPGGFGSLSERPLDRFQSSIFFHDSRAHSWSPRSIQTPV